MRFIKCAVLAVAVLITSKSAFAKNNVLFIGDSRTYGIGKYCTDRNKYYFLAEGGVGVSFVDKSLKVKLGKCMSNAVINTLTGQGSGDTVDLVSACKRHKIKKIIYNLGVNGVSNYRKNYKVAVKTMKRLKKKTRCSVYFATVFQLLTGAKVQAITMLWNTISLSLLITTL